MVCPTGSGGRERLEIYLVHLLLAFRPLIFVSGVLLLVYAVIAMIASSLAGFASLVPCDFPAAARVPYDVTLHRPLGCLDWHAVAARRLIPAGNG